MNIVHNKKAKYDVYIGRENKGSNLPASKWGNPYIIGVHGTREEVIAMYEKWLPNQPQLLRDLHELDGKTLGCWCNWPNEDCHGRILLEARKKQVMENQPKEKKIRLAVVGSRTFDDKERLFKLLDKNRERIEMIVSGGAQGADEFARQWAEERGFPCLIYYAQWRDEEQNFDKGAGYKRNWLICRAADEVLAFWDGKSRGTAHNFEICETIGRKITILNFVPKPKPEPTEYKELGEVVKEKKRRGRPKKQDTQPEQALKVPEVVKSEIATPTIVKPIEQSITVVVKDTQNKEESSVDI